MSVTSLDSGGTLTAPVDGGLCPDPCLTPVNPVQVQQLYEGRYVLAEGIASAFVAWLVRGRIQRRTRRTGA
jgi:hypothetical protein